MSTGEAQPANSGMTKLGNVAIKGEGN